MARNSFEAVCLTELIAVSFPHRWRFSAGKFIVRSIQIFRAKLLQFTADSGIKPFCEHSRSTRKAAFYRKEIVLACMSVDSVRRRRFFTRPAEEIS